MNAKIGSNKAVTTAHAGLGEYEAALDAEALVTQGIALARMSRFQPALTVLQRAAQLADTAGHMESSGRAFLTMVIELRNFLSPDQARAFYLEADRRLGEELDPMTVELLRACGRLLAATATSSPVVPAIAKGSLEQEVLRYEGEWIRQALEQTKGSVTRAAKLLGLTHQGLCYIINTRHKKLLAARAPVRVRRKSIMKRVTSRRATTQG